MSSALAEERKRDRNADAMGGDHGPEVIVRAAELALTTLSQGAHKPGGLGQDPQDRSW